MATHGEEWKKEGVKTGHEGTLLPRNDFLKRVEENRELRCGAQTRATTLHVGQCFDSLVRMVGVRGGVNKSGVPLYCV